MRSVKADDMSPAPGMPGALTLSAVSTRLEKESDLYSALQANGIVPDAEAFCLVYDLNPSLNDLKHLTAAGSIQVPTVSGGPELSGKIGKDYLVALTIDPEIHDQLNQRVDDLRELAARFAKLAPDRFESPAVSQKAQQNVAELAKWYAQIKKSYLRRTEPPLRRQTLVQLNNEAVTLNSLLNREMATNQQVSRSDEDQMDAIHQDLETEIQKYGQVLANQAPAAEPLYKIVINIKGGNPQTIDGLRVYYTFNGTYQDPPISPPVTSFPFGQLGSGKFEMLPVKNYKIWAALDGDPGHPLTPPLAVKVSPLGGAEQAFDISLAKGSR
ncbi:MAG TPA: hypothetical protein VGG85_01670 [Terracidiphilus sp.]